MFKKKPGQLFSVVKISQHTILLSLLQVMCCVLFHLWLTKTLPNQGTEHVSGCARQDSEKSGHMLHV